MTTTTNRNMSVIVKFFPKIFDFGKITTYRGIFLSNNRDGLLQLKHPRVILLCIRIYEVLPYIMSGVDDSIVDFLENRIKNPKNYNIVALSSCMIVTLKNRGIFFVSFLPLTCFLSIS
jgi:hypothetical protein